MKRYITLLTLLTSCASDHSKLDDEPYTQHQALPIVPFDAPLDAMQSKPHAHLTHIFYLIQNDKIDEAIDIVLKAKEEDPYLFHSGLLQRIGLAILEQGRLSNARDDAVTTLYGVGIAQDERLVPLVEKALSTDDPQLELVAVSVLASFQNEQADELLIKALKSNYIFVRLEAAYALAQKKSPKAYGQIEALLYKLDPEFRPLFPRLFGIDGSPASTQMVKRFLFDHDERVRVEAILTSCDMDCEDFLPQIRLLGEDPQAAQQEAAAYALGVFHDEKSVPLLQRIADSDTSASLSARYALYEMGVTHQRDMIIKEAKKANPFAIRLLGSMAGTDEFLIWCLASQDSSVRINASLSLLEKKHSACRDVLESILLDSQADYTFQPIYSHGHALNAWRVVPSSSQQFTADPSFFELSLRMREHVLVQAAELPEQDFLYLAYQILAYQQKDLIPLCVQLLQNIHTPACIELLQAGASRVGAPFVRAWCRLALFRLNEPGPYAEAVRATVEKHEDKGVFEARPVLPWRMREEETKYALTLEESAQLLLECYQALAERQDEKGIELLLRAIRDGNIHNRYALAGLLLRSSQ